MLVADAASRTVSWTLVNNRWGWVMARDLRVNPVDLHMSADQMDMHRADLQTAHEAADSTVKGAQTGWVGASAAALQANLAESQATTTELCGEIGCQGAAFRTAADAYEHTDNVGTPG